MKRIVALTVLLLLLLTGRSTVSAGSANPSSAPPDSSYPCGLVDNATVEGAVGGSSGHRVFDGPMCEWQVDGPSGSVVALFAWFVNGTMERERKSDMSLGYSVTDTKVTYRHAIAVHAPTDPNSCGVATGTDSGVVQWWIRYRSTTYRGNPCDAAQVLSADTLNLEP